jgi:hypothetical protein
VLTPVGKRGKQGQTQEETEWQCCVVPETHSGFPQEKKLILLGAKETEQPFRVVWK